MDFKLSNIEEITQLVIRYFEIFTKPDKELISHKEDLKTTEFTGILPLIEYEADTPCFKLGEGKQLLVKSFIPNEYKQVNFLDLKDKKLCLDSSTQEKWIELANKDGYTLHLIDSKSLTGIYNHCPNTTVEAVKFLSDSNLNHEPAQVHYLLSNEAYQECNL
ncbi:hypothetical protein I862_02970 [endosymbiont of Acanthamoeba sp. UWC8]|uniref:hypothetical protein n=1 Tax=endosymbiont of Acanthamoeba sp. UWC8 TaxID=86106 RepID=UPI0004D0CE21|nr:hypothetical protein [endosymbiont of Acanthamoeba sp. UWC8]AIF81157.1 hypothetical protein I862_02970 [endosymbiont of Acanthamoeba sp. UWC8]